jgi:hypothetical protein
MSSILQALWHLFPDHFPSVAERFEEDDDPEACLDESSSANHEYEEIETSASAPMFGNEVLYTNYTLNSEFPSCLYTHGYLTDFVCCCSINYRRVLELSESEDSMSYLNTMNDALLPSTIGTAFGEANTLNHDNVNQAFDIGTSIAAASDNLSSNTENIDMSWLLHSNGPSGTSAYNFDFMDASDEGYPYHNMNYKLARFRFDPTAAMAHSSQPGDLFLPPPTHSLIPPPESRFTQFSASGQYSGSSQPK